MFDHGKRKQICEGTKGYAAPEQYQGYLRPGSDIYALGKTLEKLCGKKKWQWILYPDFFWLLFRCTRKQEKYRYSDMSSVQKRIRKLENRYRMITWRKRFLEAAAAGILIGTLILIAGLLKTEEFSVAISEVTDLYYEARQYPEDSKDREKCCMAAEKRLQRLSRNYGEKEQQRRIINKTAGFGTGNQPEGKQRKSCDDKQHVGRALQQRRPAGQSAPADDAVA